jgi:hypothetical protein
MVIRKMSLRWNQAMLTLLGGDSEFVEPSSVSMSVALTGCIVQGFKEVDGCVVPSSFASTSIWNSARRKIENIDDETGVEVALSEVHIENFVEKAIDISELARLGLDFGFFLRRELKKSGIPGPFRIVVSARSADPDLRVSDTCTVRFHRQRTGQVWLADDLEQYREEAIAVLEF